MTIRLRKRPLLMRVRNHYRVYRAVGMSPLAALRAANPPRPEN